MNEMRKLIKLMEALGEIDDRGDGPDEVVENHSITYRDHVEIRDYEQDDSRDSSGDPRSRDSLRGSTAVGDGELNQAVVNTESGELLFVGPQDQAEQFVDDLENELEVVELSHRPYCEVWPRESGTYSWFRGTREECEHFIHGDSNLDESRGEGHGDDEEVFFVIVDGDEEAASLVSLTKEGGRWQESLHKGPRPYGFGSKGYMGYLTVDDVQSWLNRDYSYVMGPFDYDDGLAQWEEYSIPESTAPGQQRFHENTKDRPELDLDFGLDEPEFDQYDAEEIGSIVNDEPQDEDPLHVHHQSRIKSGIERVYRALGDDNPNPMLTLNALRRLTQGKMPMGPQAQNLATLSGGLLTLLEDPASVSLLIRALKGNTSS